MPSQLGSEQPVQSNGGRYTQYSDIKPVELCPEVGEGYWRKGFGGFESVLDVVVGNVDVDWGIDGVECFGVGRW